MEMDEMHRKILHDHRDYLLRNLEPMKLLPYLNTVLDESDRQEIEQEPTRNRKVVKLLDMLPKRGPDAFDAFIKALEETQKFMARFLKQETDKPCSHCVKLEEDLKKVRSAKKKLEEDVLKMNNEIKQFKEYRKQENQKVRQDQENWKKYLEESNGRIAEKTEEHFRKMTTLQKENQELRDEIEQTRCKNTQLTRKNEALKKMTHKDLEDEKGKGKKVKGNLEAVPKGKKKAMEETEQLKFNKKLNKQDESCSHCEKLEGKLNLITSERDSMREQNQNSDKEVLNLKNRIKEMSEDNQRTKKELQILREEREKRDIEKIQEEGQHIRKWALKNIKAKRGVVYTFATDFGKRIWVSGSSTRIIATRSSDHKGFAKDLLEKGRGAVSGTKDEKNSWWRVDLPAKYVLNLTHYTLSRSRNDQESYILNWRLEGSLDGYTWAILKEHKDDSELKAHPYSYTWSVNGELGAFRYFRIYQTGKNSSDKHNIFLSGIELYGVLLMGS
ncbi:golgin subfamily A member 6-like protein 7 [Montipora capricornis]|uniref:golgin subfamily A member 6-like protein 7 n=1 Tax=Montipora capricornis TaxID=246305 RepID=UPI0035F1E737